jgi:hypothetical protein
MTLARIQSEWKSYRSCLSKVEKKAFDDMFALAKKHTMESSCAVRLDPFRPIVMSILLEHYMELKALRTLGE